MQAGAVARVVGAARASGILSEETPLAGFIDFDAVRGCVDAMRDAFPAHWHHLFAAKANPLVPVLRRMRQLGLGCEAASAGELALALAAGFTAEDIMLDSPTKTMAELRRALELGVALNVDNFQELRRVDELARQGEAASIGLRVNPQVGIGSIAATSTAGRDSKFGVPLKDAGSRRAVIDAVTARPFLRRLHLHVGSQGCSLELLASGVVEVVTLARSINDAAGAQRVDCIDIGGGLPVNYDRDEMQPTYAAYAAVLAQRAPELFCGDFEVTTEFGRSLIAKCGVLVTAVEYTKTAGGASVAMTHAGADSLTRSVLLPETWPLRVRCFDAAGTPRDGPLSPWDVAGPLCFSGDVIARDRMLPGIEPGDWVAVLDTGAYFFSSPWTYNSRPAPPVFGVERNDAGDPTFHVLRSAQSIDDVVRANGGFPPTDDA